MRVFLCSFSGFSIAIPITFVSSITLINGNYDKAVDFSKDSGNIYVSLPVLLNYPAEKIKHGIILKNREKDDIGNNPDGNIILLTTEIECETEIQDDKIFSVQKILKNMKFSFIFNGIFFDALFNRFGNTILILNPDFFLDKD
jgi:hypothetical protein